jgi:hypothetical protein
MGLFGDVDAADIPENPFYVAPGTYYCVLTEANIMAKKNVKEDDLSPSGLSLKWVIEDEDSEFNGQNVSDWFNMYPGITEDDLTAKIKQDMSRARQRFTQMGLTTEEMNGLDQEENRNELIGMHAYVTVKETPDKNDPDKIYTNIVKVSLEEE